MVAPSVKREFATKEVFPTPLIHMIAAPPSAARLVSLGVSTVIGYRLNPEFGKVIMVEPLTVLPSPNSSAQ